MLQLTRMVMGPKDSISITATYFIRYLWVTQGWWDLSVRQMASLTPSLTSGTSSGPVALVRHIFMRVWTNIKGSTIFLTPTRLPGKIDYASTTSKCKKSLGGNITTLFQTPTFCQMSMETSWTIIKSWSSLIPGETFGLWSQVTLVKVKESIL